MDEELPLPLDPVVDGTALRRWTRGDTTRVVIAAAVLVGTGIIARAGVSGSEQAVFEAINQGPDWLYRPVWLVMQLGNVWVAVGVGLLIGLATRRWWVALALVAAPLVAWELAKAVKQVVERGRPDTLVAGMQLRGPAETGFGFISGHATVAFALAGAAAALLQVRWAVLLFVAAGLVAVGRVYVGVHLPLDVVGGAACGVLIGEAVRALEIAVAGRRDDDLTSTAGGQNAARRARRRARG